MTVFAAANILKQFEKEEMDGQKNDKEVNVVPNDVADQVGNLDTEGSGEQNDVNNITEQQRVEINDGNCTDINSTSDSFFKKRRPNVTKSKQQRKERRCISKVVGGKAITESETAEKVKAHVESVKKGKSSAKKSTSTSTATKSSFKPPFKQVPSTAPTTSTRSLTPSVGEKSLKRKRTTYRSCSTSGTPKPGPSGKQIYVVSDTPSDSQTDSDDEEKCCVCNKFQPEELRNCASIVFTKWGECMFE